MTGRGTLSVALGICEFRQSCFSTNETLEINQKLDFGDNVRKLYSVISKETPQELDFHLIATSKNILREIRISQPMP